MNYVMMIRFGDNDFYNEFRDALSIFRDMILDYGEIDRFQDKSEVVKLMNVITPAITRAHRIMMRWKDDTKIESSASHVQISEEEVYIGQEVYDFLLEKNFDGNYAWFGLDLNLPKEQQFFVY